MKVRKNEQEQTELELKSGDQIKCTDYEGNAAYFMICNVFNDEYLLVTLGTDNDNDRSWYSNGNLTKNCTRTAYSDEFTTISELISNMKDNFAKVEKVNLELVEVDDSDDN